MRPEDYFPIVQAAVRDAIDDFSFSSYGLDDVDVTKEDPGCREWIGDLATAIATGLTRLPSDTGTNLA